MQHSSSNLQKAKTILPSSYVVSKAIMTQLPKALKIQQAPYHDSLYSEKERGVTIDRLLQLCQIEADVTSKLCNKKKKKNHDIEWEYIRCHLL